MFTPAQVEILDSLALIPYYPKERHQLVLAEIYKFARLAFDENLQWLADTAVNDMREWKGVGELRGLWCTRFPPADGIETHSDLPGHTPLDIEAEAYEEHQQIKGAEQATPHPARVLAAPSRDQRSRQSYQQMEKFLARRAELMQIWLDANRGKNMLMTQPGKMPLELWEELLNAFQGALKGA